MSAAELSRGDGFPTEAGGEVYDINSMDGLLAWCSKESLPLWRHAETARGTWTLGASCRGVACDDRLPKPRTRHRGGLCPVASSLSAKPALSSASHRALTMLPKRAARLAAYALATAEENAASGEVVTAPTCGSCGVVPAVLRFISEDIACAEDEILKALATAGLVGAVARENALYLRGGGSAARAR